MFTSSLTRRSPSAKILGDPVQQKLRLPARQGGLAHEHEILDSPVLKMVTVRIARMIMTVMIMIVAGKPHDLVRIVLIRLDVEPWPRIRPWVGGVETRRRQQLGLTTAEDQSTSAISGLNGSSWRRSTRNLALRRFAGRR